MSVHGFRAVHPNELLKKFLKSDSQTVSVPLFTETKDGKPERLPLTTANEVLTWWKQNHDRELLIEDSETWDRAATPAPSAAKTWETAEIRFEKRLGEYRDLKPAERTERIQGLHEELRKALDAGKDPKKKNDVIWNASEETYLLAKGAFDRAGSRGMGEVTAAKSALHGEELPEDARNLCKDIVTKMLDDIGSRMETRRFFDKLGDFDDSGTLAHINRVFVQSAKFLHYIQFNLRNGLEAELKRLYEPTQKYGRYYGHDYERAFLEPLGDAVVTGEMTGMAALLHDSGKIPNLDYFESAEAYDRNAIEAHAMTGYELLVSAGPWALEAAFIAGSHHEYNGHPKGYGLRRSRPQFARDLHAPHRLSLRLDRVLAGEATDHFLNEIIQIIDVYDALRCGRRRYRERAFTESETLGMMKEMANEEGKLHLVLFDLFVGFVAADLSGDSLLVHFDTSRLLKNS